VGTALEVGLTKLAIGQAIPIHSLIVIIRYEPSSRLIGYIIVQLVIAQRKHASLTGPMLNWHIIAERLAVSRERNLTGLRRLAHTSGTTVRQAVKTLWKTDPAGG
jgi:hypothetical protein